MNIHQTLEALGVRPSKRRGQNFLFQDSAAQRIVSFADIPIEAPVLEVGPGLGALTKHLLAASGKLHLVEVEEKFCQYLISQFEGLSQSQITNADILSLDIQLLKKKLDCEKIVFVSNAPYSISTDIVLWILENREHIGQATLLLQRQFAERLAADSGTGEYGSLSVSAQLFFDLSLGPVFSGNIFHPSAEVESRLIKMIPLGNPRFEIPNHKLFERIVRAAFSHRRKTLINSFDASSFGLDKEQLRAAFKQCGIDEKCRAETLSIKQFAELSVAIDSLFPS
jgi:16S rRNA (adenine1518-N6/adenine1519-N6)-dimethyltransferase